MKTKLYAGKQICIQCGKVCNENRTGLCFRCATTPCSFPGCKETYFRNGVRQACVYHTALLKRIRSGAVPGFIEHTGIAGLTETGLSLSMMAFFLAGAAFMLVWGR